MSEEMVMPDPEALYTQAAHESEDQWARQLAGSEGPVPEPVRQQLLRELLERWTREHQKGRPPTEEPTI